VLAKTAEVNFLLRGGLAIGNAAIAARLFFENARLSSRMRGIFKTFSENLRLFEVILGFFKYFDSF
jgi:hypothetical protein